MRTHDADGLQARTHALEQLGPGSIQVRLGLS